MVEPKKDLEGNALLNEGEVINVHVEATSTSPYSQTLKGNFKEFKFCIKGMHEI